MSAAIPTRFIRFAVAGALVLAAMPAVALGGDGNKKSNKTTSSTTTAAATKIEPGCGYTTSQVFMPFGDSAQYFLAPGGDAESSRWKTAGGASIASGKGVLGLGSSVYALPDGGSITSESFCLGYDSPTLRYSINDPGVAGAVLKVEVIWTSPSGKVYTVPIGWIKSGTAGVRLASPNFLLANLAGLLTETGTTSVQLRFTGTGATWQVDDIYVDPFKRV